MSAGGMAAIRLVMCDRMVPFVRCALACENDCHDFSIMNTRARCTSVCSECDPLPWPVRISFRLTFECVTHSYKTNYIVDMIIKWLVIAVNL